MGLFSSKKKTPPPQPAPVRKGRKATAGPPTPATTTKGRKTTTTPAPQKANPTATTTTAAAVPADVRRQIVDQVCARYQADRLQPHEVVIKANGEIWIDRRGRDPRNVPFVIGTWK
ncbi:MULTISPECIES: hypothetical protein [Protofrankia]|uniref:Uncharacterized protein n=1 Tax=Protofrankia coriariae TaxID=1562887 RepID=A0ABR5F461_9ACTN|nr:MULTISPECIES: hypothetical protein [Protofrankia]KLL11473.1 hypothetical protein FrCorBMG51_10290 [Protofrankia coriariae]ONH34956.1 hypothetical protein BL254_13420 [Protofrankia sp. BMG5.30]